MKRLNFILLYFIAFFSSLQADTAKLPGGIVHYDHEMFGPTNTMLILCPGIVSGFIKDGFTRIDMGTAEMYGHDFIYTYLISKRIRTKASLATPDFGASKIANIPSIRYVHKKLTIFNAMRSNDTEIIKCTIEDN